YLLQQRYYESLVALKGALTANPDFAAAHANLGRLYVATKMPFTAVGELEKADKLKPGDVTILCDLGEANLRTLNLNAAKETYERALKADPKSPQAQIGLGKALYGLAKY